MAKAIKNGKVIRIEEMKVLLREGKDRKHILQILAKTCRVSERTLDGELKQAKEAIRLEMEEAEAVRQALLSEQLKDEINASIKSDLELDLILSQIATGNLQIEEWVRGEPVLRNVAPIEQIAAIDKLFKRRGSYAPTKTANTDKSGNDVTPPLTDNQVDKILQELNKGK